MTMHRGFTLIELMIVVAVIAIIAAIAIPSYSEYVLKGRRADATRFAGEMQLALEHWRAENPSYASCGAPPCGSGTYPTLPSATASPFYVIEIVAANTNATNYRITASPRSGSAQAGDRCSVLTLDRAINQGKPSWTNPACQ